MFFSVFFFIHVLDLFPELSDYDFIVKHTGVISLKEVAYDKESF